MLFPTLDYLIFLPLIAGLYWSSPKHWRLIVLGLASLIFYASWNLAYLSILLFVTGIAWWLGKPKLQESPLAKKWLGTALLFLPLFVFKYWDWIGWNIEQIFSIFSPSFELPRTGMLLPVGISFFTFQAVAYVIDCRRSKDHEKNPWRFLTFLAFFPQLVAGPIVRRHELLPQLKELPLLKTGFVDKAIFRIIKGMVKKLLIADVIQMAIVDPVFSDPSAYTGLEVWIALYAYTLQIYYDFSAYTDIAIGSALLFGIQLPENFRRPYQATSVAEFWRRWHITLSNWVRDYIYYPLGGSRMDSSWKVYRNIILTMVVIGFGMNNLSIVIPLEKRGLFFWRRG